MASRKGKKKERVENPTLFVFEGSIQHYDEGSMRKLSMQVTPEEWLKIATETMEYNIFLECLKETASPILKEEWTEHDEWWRLQLGVAATSLNHDVAIQVDLDDVILAYGRVGCN